MSLIRANAVSREGMQFWIGPVGELEDGAGEWGFEIFGESKKYIAGFVYPDKDMADAAARAMLNVLRNAVFIVSDSD